MGEWYDYAQLVMRLVIIMWFVVLLNYASGLRHSETLFAFWYACYSLWLYSSWSRLLLQAWQSAL